MTDSLKDIPILYEKAKNSGYLDGVYCATADCSDFPSLEITFEGDNGNFTLELESKYFLRPGNGKNHYYIGIFSSTGTGTTVNPFNSSLVKNSFTSIIPSMITPT